MFCGNWVQMLLLRKGVWFRCNYGAVKWGCWWRLKSNEDVDSGVISSEASGRVRHRRVFEKQTGGVAHVCKRFTRAWRLFKSRIHATWKNKKTKNKNNMCTKKGQNWSIFHLLSSLIWIFSSEKRQNPERSAWSSSSFGSNALGPQASGFKHALSDVVSSSAAAGHQDTSPAVSWTHLQALAPVVLTPALAHPSVLRSEFFYFFANLLLHVCYLHMYFAQSSSVVNTLQSACLSDCVYY